MDTTNNRKRPPPPDCPWKVVLIRDESNAWKFRKSSSSPNTSEHNHELTMEEDWPQEVIHKIIQLARQKGQQQELDEIREIIKLQFPQITWNDRRFLNYFMDERKRQRQKETTERVQKLILSSTKLCSVVAANEDWASCVESDLIKMLNTYKQRTRVSNQSLDTMVDLQMDMIHSEIDTKSTGTGGGRKNMPVHNNKKRKSTSNIHQQQQQQQQPVGVQIMSIPSCTLFIRSQPLRSLSEPSSSSNSTRRTLNDIVSSTATAIPNQQQLNASFGVNSVFNLTSPILSPSSTSSIQQRIDYGNSFRNNDMLQSPPIPDSNMVISPNYNTSSSNTYNHSMYSFSPYQQQQQQSSSTTTTHSGYNGGSNNDFSFEPSSTAYGQLTTTPSPAPIVIHGRHGTSSSGGSGGNMYYMGRDSSSTNSNSSIQQRIMLQQQEYEQHTRHFMDPSHHNVHLPTIRSSNMNPHDALVQHHHMNSNPPQQQNWS
ncbi:unnamed protein product [Mucor hiemalis]